MPRLFFVWIPVREVMRPGQPWLRKKDSSASGASGRLK